MQQLRTSDKNRTEVLCAVFYWILALLVIAAGVCPRFGMPQWPLMDKDSVSYLAPAISKYAGGAFEGMQSRSFPYPAMIYAALAAFNSFKAVAVLQHLSGILAGILMILAWNQARFLIRLPVLPELAYRLIGLLPALIFLISSKNMLYEHFLRPEAVMPFFVMGAVFLTVQFIRAALAEDRTRAAFIYGTALIFDSALMYFIKPSWGFNVLLCSLPVAVSFFAKKEPFGWKALRMAVPVILVLGLLVWPDRVLKKRDPMGNLFLPETLFVIHANIILNQLDADLNHNDTAYSTELLRSVEQTLREEIHPEKAARKMATMDFDPDYLHFRSPLFQKMRDELGDNERLASFCFYYYKRAFFKRPMEMGQKIRKSMSVFYRAECPVYEAEKKGISLAKAYADTVKLISIRSTANQSPARSLYLEACKNLGHAKHVIRPSWLGPGVYKALRFSFLPSLIAAMILCLGIFFSGSLRPGLWLFGAFVLLMFSYNFGNCLTVSIAHTLGIRRYVHSQQVFVVFAHFLSLVLLLETGLAIWRQQRRITRRKTVEENAPIAATLQG